jgi:hypothetical protein
MGNLIALLTFAGTELFFSVLYGVPFFFLWNYMAPRYLSMLPWEYTHVPLWDCILMFVLASFIRKLLGVTHGKS